MSTEAELEKELDKLYELERVVLSKWLQDRPRPQELPRLVFAVLFILHSEGKLK